MHGQETTSAAGTASPGTTAAPLSGSPASHGSSPAERRTGGSDQRPPRELSVPLRGIAIAQVSERLQAEPAFMTDGRNAQTIHDDGLGRVIVSVVAAGRDIGARRTEGHVALLLHEGRGTLRRADEALELSAGMMVVLAPGAEWSFQANESACLVGTFWDFGDDAAGGWTEPAGAATPA